jgi:hypothetical protein
MAVQPQLCICRDLRKENSCSKGMQNKNSLVNFNFKVAKNFKGGVK